MVKKTKTKKKQKTERPLQTEKETLRISKEKLTAIADEWRTTFDALKDAVSVIEVDGKIVRSNRAMSDFLGKPFHEIIGRTCWELVHGTSEPIEACPIVRMKETHQREILTLQINDRWFEVSADPISDESGGLNGAIHTISDITEKKEAEEKLRESEGKLSAMLQSIGDHISMIDKDLNIIWANETARKIFGDDIIGRKCYEAYHRRKEPCEPYSCLTLKAFQDGTVHEHETQVIGKDGEIIYFHCTTNVAMRDKDGKPTAVIEVSRDITERKKIEDALRVTNETLQSLIKASPLAIIILDSDGNVKLWNPAAENIFGWSEQEVLGRPHPIVPEDKQDEFRAYLNAVLKGNTFWEDEIIRQKKDGSLIDISLSTALSRDAKGEVIGVLGIVADITKRKLIEEALRKSEQKYRTLFTSSCDGITLADLEGYITDCNQEYSNMLGYSLEELRKITYLSLTPAKWHEANKEMAARVMHGGYSGEFEKEYIRKDGTVFPVVLRTWRIDDNKGNPVGLCSIVRDITERKRMEEELKRSHEMKIFGQLAAGVAHEVRNPRNAILAITEALFQDIGENPEYLPYLEHIRNQVDRLSILMKDLLEIGKPISQEIFQTETVAGIFTSTIALWNMTDISKRNTLRFISHPESEKLFVNTDIARLQQVVLNLLQNAAQNSPEGSEIVIQVFEPKDKTVNIHNTLIDLPAEAILQ